MANKVIKESNVPLKLFSEIVVLSGKTKNQTGIIFDLMLGKKKPILLQYKMFPAAVIVLSIDLNIEKKSSLPRDTGI